MTRVFMLATFSLLATSLPLTAQTPNGAVQGAVQGSLADIAAGDDVSLLSANN